MPSRRAQKRKWVPSGLVSLLAHLEMLLLSILGGGGEISSGLKYQRVSALLGEREGERRTLWCSRGRLWIPRLPTSCLLLQPEAPAGLTFPTPSGSCQAVQGPTPLSSAAQVFHFRC